MPHTTRPNLLASAKGYVMKLARQGALPDPDEAAAWDQFFDQYNLILSRFAAKLGFSQTDAEDLAQEVWLDVLRLLPAFDYDRSKGGFRRWLYRIMRSKAVDEARRRARCRERQVGEGASDFWAKQQDPKGQDPGQALEREFRAEVVALAVQHLRSRTTDKEWQAFELCRLNGLASPAAARQMGLSHDATRKCLQRAMTKLRHILQDLIGEQEDG